LRKNASLQKNITISVTFLCISSPTILHLATHACLDQENPNFNRIYFQDDFVHMSELYEMDISSELVVFSACNTGSGFLTKGEGVMSLAKGFI